MQGGQNFFEPIRTKIRRFSEEIHKIRTIFEKKIRTIHTMDTGLILDPGYWIQDTGYWILDTGYGILDTGYWIHDTGYMIQDTGYRILDTGYWI